MGEKGCAVVVIVVLAVICCLIAYVKGSWDGSTFTREQMQAAAKEAGAGEYYIDSNNHLAFRWTPGRE